MTSLVVFTDGACSANGKKNATGAYATVWPDHPEMDGGWPLEGGEKAATNNRAEMMGLIKSFEIADVIDPERKKHLEVYTDSMFMINCVTKWLANWKKNGFRKSDGSSVRNQDLLLRIDALRLKRVLVMNHVRAHTKGTDWKSKNNAKADALAKNACGCSE